MRGEHYEVGTKLVSVPSDAPGDVALGDGVYVGLDRDARRSPADETLEIGGCVGDVGQVRLAVNESGRVALNDVEQCYRRAGMVSEPPCPGQS